MKVHICGLLFLLPLQNSPVFPLICPFSPSPLYVGGRWRPTSMAADEGAPQHEAITVSSWTGSPMWSPDKLLWWQQGHRAQPGHTHTDTHTPQADAEHTNATTHRRSHLSSGGADTVAGCGCRNQQDWNVTYCYSSHLATIEDHRQLAPQCLHADLCRSLGAAGCCGVLLGSFHYLGIRSLQQLIN